MFNCKFCNSTLEMKESASVRALTLVSEDLKAIESHTRQTAADVEMVQDQLVRIRHDPVARWNKRMDDLAEEIELITHDILLADKDRRRQQFKASVHALVCIALYTVGLGSGFAAVELGIDGPDATGGLWALLSATSLGVAIFWTMVSVIASKSVERKRWDIVELHDALFAAEDEYEAWRLREPL